MENTLNNICNKRVTKFSQYLHLGWEIVYIVCNKIKFKLLHWGVHDTKNVIFIIHNVS